MNNKLYKYINISKKYIIFYVTIAGSLWFLMGITLWSGQKYLLYPRYVVPAALGWSHPAIERVSVDTSDGERLKGFWRPPSSPVGNVVISFLGNGSAPEAHAVRFSRPPWSDHGWGFMTIAYRGYPGSTGSPTEEGLLRDAEASVAFVRGRAPHARILFHGHSLGTGVAIAMASRYPSKGLYLEAAYNSMVDVAHYHYWLWQVFPIVDTFRSEDRIPLVRAPILAIHGENDLVVPLEFDRRLMAAAGISGTHSLISLPGETHVSIFGMKDEFAESMFRDLPDVRPGVF